MKKYIKIIAVALVSLNLISCDVINRTAIKDNKIETEGYTKFTYTSYDSFDTQITLMAFDRSQEEFNKKTKIFNDEFIRYHKLYDYYRTYDGINNIMTINNNAGKEPVKVDPEIIELLVKSKEYYKRGHEKTNVAMGAVFYPWHELREIYISDDLVMDSSSNTEETKIPPMEELKKAKEISNIDDMVIDEKNSTVFLKKEGMRIDVGAFAKGFATEKVAQKMKDLGLNQAIISAGGNIKIIGPPMLKDKKDWSVGIQNPNMRQDGNPTLDLLYLKEGSVVSSGDYERFYMYKGEVMHHIIDPVTLMPGRNFRQVTILTEDSGKADFFSTALFLMTYEEGLEVAKKEGLDVIWVFPDLSVKTTDNIKKHLKSQGAGPAVE